MLPSEVDGLAAPAADGLRTLATQIAPQVLATAEVQKAWRTANRTAQLQLLEILKGGNKTISTNNGEVTLQLHSLLVQLAAQLGLQQQFESVQSKLQGSTGETARSAAEEKLGVKLPPTSGGIVLLRSSQLKTAQDIVKAIKGLAIVLPLLALLLFVLAIWLADGWRRVALRTSGWCLVGIGLLAVLARRLLSELRRQLARQGPLEQARGRTRLLDRHLAAVRPRGRDDHLRPRRRRRGLGRREHAARGRAAPRAGAVAARARAVRLRHRRPVSAARRDLGAVPLDPRGDPRARLRDPARARRRDAATEDRARVPRRAARRRHARAARVVRRAPALDGRRGLLAAFQRLDRRRIRRAAVVATVAATRRSPTSSGSPACTTAASSPTRSSARRRRRSCDPAPDLLRSLVAPRAQTRQFGHVHKGVGYLVTF